MTDCGCNNFPASLGNVTFGASVGIGTSPSYTLDLIGADTADSGLRVGTLGYTNLPPTLGTTDGVILSARGLNVVSDGAALAAGPSSGVGIAVDRTAPALTLQNAGGPSLIVEAGNVGVGATAPEFTLDLIGADATSSGLRVGTAGYTNLPATLGVTNGVVLNARGLNVVSDGATLAAGPSSGVGIAVNRPGPALGLRNTNGPAMVVESGNVGIGTTAPEQLLDVAGTVRTTGILLGGNMLLSGAITDSTGQDVRVDAGGCYYAN